MLYFKKILIFTVLLTLILGLSSTLIMAQNSNEIPFDKLKTPTELQYIIDSFDRLEYNFTSFTEGEEVQQLGIKFQYQGKEKVAGLEADKILIETSTREIEEIAQMTFWLNNGEIVKMQQNKQEIPASIVNTMKGQILQPIFFPFYHFEDLKLKEIASVGKVTRSKEIISEREVDIIKVEANNLTEYELESATIELANFEDFMMTMSFSYITLDETEADYEEGRFEVTGIKLR